MFWAALGRYTPFCVSSEQAAYKQHNSLRVVDAGYRRYFRSGEYLLFLFVSHSDS